ncbi:MAG: hypothetical protein LZF60_360088 [Nitrospira sp.]|nr:MAG: hypothetical protein LZF60_360088 [Nitrospira sp.]
MPTAKPLTKVSYEVCTDSAEYGPFESCGSIHDDLREAVRDLKQERKKRPWVHLVRHDITKLSSIEVARLELQLKGKKKG